MTSFTHAGQYGAEPIQDTLGTPLPNTAVLVRDAGTTTTSTLYTDDTMESQAENPTASDSLGNLTFFAVPGAYDLVYAGQAPVTVYVNVNAGDIAPEPGALLAANNLDDLVSASTARSNLGLGTAATAASSAFDSAGAASTAQSNAETFATNAVATETSRAEAAEALLAPLASPALTGTPTAPTVAGSSDSTTKIATTAFVQAVASGIVPSGALLIANNLSDLASASTARSNLGLGTAATAASSAFDLAGAASTAQSNAETFATNAVATETSRAEAAEALALLIAHNLSDLTSASTARTNLGLGTAAVQNVGAFAQVANNLSDLASASTARTNLGLGTAAVQNVGVFAQVANNLSDLASAFSARTNLGLPSIAAKHVRAPVLYDGYPVIGPAQSSPNIMGAVAAQYPIVSGDVYGEVLLSPDGSALWIVDNSSGTGTVRMFSVNQINSANQLGTTFTVASGYQICGICLGPDGQIWMTVYDGGTSKIAAYNIYSESITDYTTGLTAGAFSQVSLSPIIAGPDGNLYFLEDNKSKIGRITTAGTITEWATITGTGGVWGICVGPDGNIWFTCNATGKVSVLNLSTATVTEYAAYSAAPCSIVTALDGNLYYRENTHGHLVQLTPAGVSTAITDFSLGSSDECAQSILSAADGRMYLADSQDVGTSAIFSFSTGLNGTMNKTSVTVASANAGLSPFTGICTGPDGCVVLLGKGGIQVVPRARLGVLEAETSRFGTVTVNGTAGAILGIMPIYTSYHKRVIVQVGTTFVSAAGVTLTFPLPFGTFAAASFVTSGVSVVVTTAHVVVTCASALGVNGLIVIEGY